MAWATTKGFCFRATSGYVTDPTNTTYVVMDVYPATRSIGGESVTFGWDSATSLDGRDRNASAPVELAGLNFVDSTSATRYFRVDVPGTGTYRVQIAVGDRGGNACTPNVAIKDGVGGTTLLTLQDNAIGGGEFFDASGATHASASAWDSSGRVWTSALSVTGTAIAFYIASDPVTYTSVNLAFLNIEQLTSGPAFTPTAGAMTLAGGQPSLSFDGALTYAVGAGALTFVGGTPVVVSGGLLLRGRGMDDMREFR